jgi:phosphopantothenoylcysteine decarboxylase/phosphopantothenate--cysteine ligase
MNDNMFTHPVTQKNIAQLKALGYHFADPVEGDLACGRVGIGHIAPEDVILASVQNILSQKRTRRR